VEPWLIPVISLAGSAVMSYVGVRIVVTRLETQMDDVRDWVKDLRKRAHEANDALLIHDGEIEELMRRLNVDPRPKRRRREE
jgi:hypothetical protein